MKYLGIDYGKKKVGVAISDGQLASIYNVVESSGLEDSLNQIKAIIKEEDINQVVVGVPESGEARKNAENFINRLSKDVSVIKVDETLSSYDAKRLMLELGVNKKDRQKEDAYSAALILQNFLDSLN